MQCDHFKLAWNVQIVYEHTSASYFKRWGYLNVLNVTCNYATV